MKDDWLDACTGLYFHNNKKLVAMWNICKILFSLSHGRAAVERGFSVNREVLVENLKQQSLVSQRIVYNYMTVGHSANLHEFQIQRELLLSCKGAHAKYAVASGNEKKVHVKMRRPKKKSDSR